jgi:predicted alpha/beta superfamily hydrolase
MVLSQGVQNMPAKPATILASEVRMLKSKHTGQKYRISISKPYASFKSDLKTWPFNEPLKKWPVVYLIDGNWFFGMVTAMVRNMGWFGKWSGNTTDAIIVGIGYPEDKNPQQALCDQIARRFHDLSPIPDKNLETSIGNVLMRPVFTGGAGNFLRFIRDELIPIIDKDFPTDPRKRTLVGHSLGGTFTAFALFEEPRLFSTYIIGSPSLEYGDRFIFKREETFSKRHKNLAAKVHLWVGDREESLEGTDVSDVIRFGAILEGRGYKGLTLVKQIFADLHHNEVIAPGFVSGLKIALGR